MADYSLTLQTSVVDGTPSPIRSITEIATGWQNYTDWIGGDDMGEFTVYGDAGKLQAYFDAWLRLDVIEEDGGVITWRGEIRRMELGQANVVRTFDFGECYNNLNVQYGTGERLSSWANLTECQAEYGVRSKWIISNAATSGAAGNERTFQMKKAGWPPLGVGQDIRQSTDNPYLKVYVFGYKHSINDKYVPTSISGATAISTALDTTIDYADYVSVRMISTNTNTVVDDYQKQRSWDACADWVAMTDGSDNLYRGWVDSNRKFTYKVVDLTPTYYVRNGMVYTDAGASVQLRPRWCGPGIYRDMDSVLTGQNRGGLLNDRNDFFVHRTFVDENGEFHFIPAGSIADFMTLLSAKQAASGGGEKERKWRWGKMTDEEREWWWNKHGG